MSRLSHFCFSLMTLVLPFTTVQAARGDRNDAPAGDLVIQWNRAALDAIRADGLPPPKAARDLAILHLAMFDAVNAIQPKYQPYLSGLEAPKTASAPAAAIAAAHFVLQTLFPSHGADFDHLKVAQLQTILDTQANQQQGIEVGRTTAKTLLSLRAKDNSDRQINYKHQKANLGQWKPVGNNNNAPTLPHWSGVTPFALKNPAQFRPVPPPDFRTEDYAVEINEVKDLGGKNSGSRTPDQTEIAMFWDEGPGTVTPPGQWNLIAETVVGPRGNSLIDNARIFALLNMALADSGIAAWECKYRFNSLRPETAIREPQKTKNTDIQTDVSWTSLITCPHSPEYVSGNSAYSAAASEVLGDLFGDRTSFTIGSDAKPGVTRSFDSFSEAAKEAGKSRIYGGVLTKSGDESGGRLGRDVANYVVENFLLVPSSSSKTQRQ